MAFGGQRKIPTYLVIGGLQRVHDLLLLGVADGYLATLSARRHAELLERYPDFRIAFEVAATIRGRGGMEVGDSTTNAA